MDLEKEAVANYERWIKHLKSVRKETGQKQRDIATALKQTVGYVNKFENAKVLPSVKTLFMYLLASKFDLSLLFNLNIRGVHKPAEKIRKDLIKTIKELDEESLLSLVQMSEIVRKARRKTR